MIHDLEQYVPHFDDMRDIVFVAQMPHQRDGIALEYSAWFQFLLALLEIDIEYNPSFDVGKFLTINLNINFDFFDTIIVIENRGLDSNWLTHHSSWGDIVS